MKFNFLFSVSINLLDGGCWFQDVQGATAGRVECCVPQRDEFLPRQQGRRTRQPVEYCAPRIRFFFFFLHHLREIGTFACYCFVSCEHSN